MAKREITLKISIDDRDVKTSEASLRRMRKAVENVASSGNVFSKLKSELSSLSSSFASFTGNLAADGVSFLTSKLFEGGRALLTYKSNLEQTEIGFTSLLGSGDKAKNLLQEIQQFAKSTPFEFAGIAELSQRLLGANVQAEKIIPTIRDIGNVVAATGKASQERLEGVTVAIAQILQKQKFSAEENEQLAERGISGFQILAQATGKSQAELRKLSEQGKISADMFLEALQKVSREKFGSAMEQQSKTFSGAMSNIKDSIMIVAGNAFEPIYQEISKLALGMAQEIEAQGGDMGAIGEVIGNYIVAGLTKALAAGAESSVSYMVSNIAKNLSGDASETLFPLKATEILFEGIGKGLGYNIDIFAKNTKKTIPLLAQAKGELGQIGQNANKLPDVSKQLQSDKAAQEAKKLYDTLRKTLFDLSLQVQFFGNETQVAAAKQNLLRQGITDFDSGLAKVILTEAAYLDTLKEKQKAQDEFNSKFKDFGDEIRQIREDAEFKLKFANPTELDELNRKVNQSGLEFKGLAFEINETREALRLLAISREYDKAGATTKQFIDSIKLSIEDLNTVDTTPFQSKIGEILKGLELFDPVGTKLENLGIGKVIESKILSLQRELNQLNDSAYNAIGNQEVIESALKSKTEAAINNWYAAFTLYLGTIKQKIQSGEKIDFVNFFEGEAGLQGTAADLVDFFNSVNNSADKTAIDAYKTALSELDSEILELNIELGRSAELSKADAVAKMLQTDAYKNLTPEMRAAMQAKAEEIDQLRAAQKAQEEYRDAFEETKDLVRESLDILSDSTKSVSERIVGFFGNILDKFKDMLLDLAAQYLTSKIFKLLMGNSQSSGNGSSGGGFGGIFDAIKKIFNRGGSASGGIPPTGTINAAGEYVVNGNQGGGIGSIFSSIKKLFSGRSSSGASSNGGFGGLETGNLPGVSGSPSNPVGGRGIGLAGGVAIAGMGANIIGGLIGGRVGGFLSGAGSGAALGAQIGSLFGPGPGTAIGAVVGAIGGGLLSLLGGDPKRKQDKQENIPALQKGFADALAQLRALSSDRNALYSDPQGTIAKAGEIRAQIASGFDIKFLSKKYQNESKKLIAAKLTEADAIIAELTKLTDKAGRAKDVDTRLIGNFATGAYMDSAFMAQYSSFKKRNGMLSGAFTGRDILPSMLAMGEMVLNPRQIERVKMNARFDPFRGAGIPNYNGGTYVARSPNIAPSSPSFASASSPNIVIQPNITVIIEGEGMTEAKVKNVMIDGMKTDTNVQVQLVESYDKTKRRTK